MKFCIKSFMLIAAAALAFSSCNKEIEEQQIEEQQIVVTNGTHTVNFTAVIGEQSKTTMTEGAEAATFAWSEDDEDHFIVYENNVPGETIGVIDGDIMKLAATFADSAEAPFTYTATLNGKVPGKQTLYDGKYDENSDVLIAEPITSQTTSEDFTFKFNRVVALNKMTLKGLGEDEIVTKVIVKADKDIVGSYDIVNDGWTAPADGSPSTEITIDGGEDEGVLIDNGIAVVYFNCIPVSDTQFTIDVTTDKGEYTKTFSKKIALVEGMLNRFNVAVEKKQEPSEYIKVTSELTDWSGEYLLVAPSANMALSGISNTSTKYGMGSAVEIDNDKIESTDNTNAYKLTIAHASNVSSSSQYVIKLGSSYLSWSSGNSLKTDETESENSRWILSFSEGNVLIKNYKDNTRVILWNVNSPRFACYAGQSIGNSYYATALFKLGGGGTPVPPATKYTIIVPDGLTGGIVTSDKDKAEAGETVTITAEPATGYKLSSLTSNVSGEELNGNVLTFTMPEADVTISASFDELPEVDYSGEYIIIGTDGKNGYFAMNQYVDGNNCKGKSITYNNGSVSGNNLSTCKVTLSPVEGKDGYYTILDSGDNFLYAPSTSNNYLKGNDNSTTAAAHWHVQCIDNAWTVIADNTGKDNLRNVMQYNYNSGSPIFACYASASQNAVILVPWDKVEDIIVEPVDATWSVTPESVSITEGETATVTISTNYDGTLMVESASTGIATAKISGKTITVIGVAPGTTSLTITGSATVNYKSIEEYVNVTVEAKPATTSTIINSADVVNGTAYGEHRTTDWIITFGGNNMSVGTNSSNRAKCKLATPNDKYAVSPITTENIASAFASLKSLSDVSKVKYTFDGGSNQTNTKVYLLYSSDNTTFSPITLKKGDQGGAISSDTVFEFDKCSGYFAVVFVATNSSGNWRIDNVELTFD